MRLDGILVMSDKLSRLIGLGPCDDEPKGSRGGMNWSFDDEPRGGRLGR